MCVCGRGGGGYIGKGMGLTLGCRGEGKQF